MIFEVFSRRRPSCFHFQLNNRIDRSPIYRLTPIFMISVDYFAGYLHAHRNRGFRIAISCG
ncbi:hypothetical protein HanXRQr2_Chr16g0736411 [Helianthus annuus]|uniref:Uncharacterized protein n=1 Tax=Helianthus annuus TaxID=4232 RepID=A0A9K3GXC8_HELAN|nr:hypothetical protein HanXRQr2_Chr16g0736411 [Helianthus annuus]KAJ0437296.1 hypothetical protein HanHA300_Chr16g0600431 [Helianthus annuus]KAJ0459613.1 hypothetical protein HanHA89_Chr16g0650951 [Helianthus annuus]